MTRTVSKAIAVAVCSVAAVILFGSANPKGQDRQQYIRNSYFHGPREVTVKTREGTVLSVLHVPSDVDLSIHVVRETGAAQFGVETGDVIIRVMPRNRLKDGPLLQQMLQAPFELSLQNVEVSLK